MNNKSIPKMEGFDAGTLNSSKREERALRSKTGLFKRIDVALAVSEVAGEALKTIETQAIQSQVNIALTAQNLAEAALCSSMVARAMPQIGALAVSVNAATTTVDQALASSVAAETISHYRNRAQMVELTKNLHQDGSITSDEASAIIRNAVEDAERGIARSRERMYGAEDAVAILHNFALTGIVNAQDIVK
jgi:hypothetical protein